MASTRPLTRPDRIARPPSREVVSPIGPDPAAATRILSAVGLALLLAALANIVLIWSNPGLGEPRWELTAVGMTLDRIPLLLVGLGVLSGATMLDRGVYRRRALAVLAWLLLVTFGGMGAVWVLAVFQLWNHVSNPSLFSRTVAVSAAVGMLFLAAIAVIAFTVGRGAFRRRARNPD